MDLRLSPSGPIIGSVGPGFQLKTLDVRGAVSSDQAITTTVTEIGSGIRVSLAAPDTSKKYSAELYCDVATVSTASAVAAVVNLAIQASYDGGSTWNTVASASHTIEGPANVAAHRQMRCDLPITDGSTVILDPSAPPILFRGAVSADAAGTSAVDAGAGSIYLRLNEYTSPP